MEENVEAAIAIMKKYFPGHGWRWDVTRLSTMICFHINIGLVSPEDVEQLRRLNFYYDKQGSFFYHHRRVL